jgi:hypothetical protein
MCWRAPIAMTPVFYSVAAGIPALLQKTAAKSV